MSTGADKADKDDGLTESQRLFVAEYLIDRNASLAYHRVFPDVTKRTAGNEGYRMMKNPEVKAAIEDAIRKQEKRTQMTADKVVGLMVNVAMADPGGFFDLSQGEAVPLSPRDIPYKLRLATQSIKVKRRKLKNEYDETYELEEIEYKLVDKGAMIERLAKYFRLYGDLTPLETVLTQLPAHVTGVVRQELDRSLPPAKPEPTPDPVKPDDPTESVR